MECTARHMASCHPWQVRQEEEERPLVTYDITTSVHQSILPLSSLAMILSSQMTYITAPQPLRQSRSCPLNSAWLATSNSSSGSKSGLHKLSHTPIKLSGAVPATMKSFAVSMAPILSIPHRYGVPSASRPAITGCTKYGPNRFSYSVVDTSCPNDDGLMSRSSRRRYKLCLNVNRWERVAASVARPDRPRNRRSWILYTFLSGG